mgnify:CR=1 FL=1
MRAVTIAVKDTTGVGGMIKPGNNIDIICQYVNKEIAANGEEEGIETAKILLQNVSVLAVEKITGKAGKPASEESYTTITLEVSPEDAVALTFASNSAIVSAVLRSPLDNEKSDAAKITSEELDKY